MRKLTVLIDMDDTMESLCGVWVDFLNKKHKLNVSIEDIQQWDMANAFPTLSSKEICKPLYTKRLWKKVRPMPGAIKNIKKLMQDGHKIMVVSASHPNTVGLKWKYVLSKYFWFIKSENIIFTTQKQLIRGDVLIDDAPHNLEGGEYFKLLFNAPHNKNYDEKSMIRVFNWDEVYFAVNHIANNF